MSFLVENLWIWFVLAALVGVIGYVTFQNDRNNKTLGITAILVLGILALGFGLYYGVDTDYKSVRRMLTNLAAALERDDLQAVQNFIEPNATVTRLLAQSQMALVRLPSAKFKDLKVVSNDSTAPPTAKVTFTAVVQWQTKGAGIDGFTLDRPATQMVKFDVVFVKTNDNSWLVTNECRFDPKAGM